MYRLSPADTHWPRVLTLALTLPSLTFVSYRAARARQGAATMIAGVAIIALLGQLLVSTASGQGFPGGIIVALVVTPSLAMTGGSLALAQRRSA